MSRQMVFWLQDNCKWKEENMHHCAESSYVNKIAAHNCKGKNNLTGENKSYFCEKHKIEMPTLYRHDTNASYSISRLTETGICNSLV